MGDCGTDIGNALVVSQTLESLELPVSSEGLPAIANALKFNSTLITLVLTPAGPPISFFMPSCDENMPTSTHRSDMDSVRGVDLLAHALEVNTTLEHLFISWDVDAEEGLALVNALRANQSLLRLNLRVEADAFEVGQQLVQLQSMRPTKLELTLSPTLKSYYLAFKNELELCDLGGAVPVTSIKLCFMGFGGTGKTTLLASLQRTEAVESETVEADRSVVAERTRGAEIGRLAINSKDFTVWDFAGQEQYFLAHGRLSSSAMSLYVIVVRLDDDHAQESLNYWLKFLKSHKVGPPPRIVVVGSSRDLVPDTSWAFQTAAGWTSPRLDLMVDNARTAFNESLNIQSAIILDCRKSQDIELRRLKDVLCEEHNLLCQRGLLYLAVRRHL
eukprot:m.93982 g.93982  ORF g.93982 m.93982 type:complete len:388 (+) comp15000_c0_seq2:449-1612(+)